MKQILSCLMVLCLTHSCFSLAIDGGLRAGNGTFTSLRASLFDEVVKSKPAIVRNKNVDVAVHVLDRLSEAVDVKPTVPKVKGRLSNSVEATTSDALTSVAFTAKPTESPFFLNHTLKPVMEETTVVSAVVRETTTQSAVELTVEGATTVLATKPSLQFNETTASFDTTTTPIVLPITTLVTPPSPQLTPTVTTTTAIAKTLTNEMTLTTTAMPTVKTEKPAVLDDVVNSTLEKNKTVQLTESIFTRITTAATTTVKSLLAALTKAPPKQEIVDSKNENGYKLYRFCSLYYGGVLCKDTYVATQEDTDTDSEDAVDEDVEDAKEDDDSYKPYYNNVNNDPYIFSSLYKRLLKSIQD